MATRFVGSWISRRLVFFVSVKLDEVGVLWGKWTQSGRRSDWNWYLSAIDPLFASSFFWWLFCDMFQSCSRSSLMMITTLDYHRLSSDLRSFQIWTGVGFYGFRWHGHQASQRFGSAFLLTLEKHEKLTNIKSLLRNHKKQLQATVKRQVSVYISIIFTHLVLHFAQSSVLRLRMFDEMLWYASPGRLSSLHGKVETQNLWFQECCRQPEKGCKATNLILKPCISRECL